MMETITSIKSKVLNKNASKHVPASSNIGQYKSNFG